ncbi:DNA alkylation repair protein [Lederbergia ruris]|uniref:DNA alkylation repair protein n=1 Tax=Lederbergia ruris TaxID=217495 RepID=UPI0039A296D8
MMNPYRCPNCKTNRSRFNIIDQVVNAVRLDPQSGEVIEDYNGRDPGPLHAKYQGPGKRVQCGSCGLIEDERSFIKFGEIQE